MWNNFRQLVSAVVLALILGLGIWYLQNIGGQDLVTGVVSAPKDVLASQGGRTNIVLLGIGGDGHEGGDLTDSILVISFDLSKNTAAMIPVPRDIWVPELKAKINTAYQGGLGSAKAIISSTLGMPIQYAVTLDFQGFVKAIDAVGGVDVEVANTFDDYEYPISGKETAEPISSRYEHVHFDAGLTHMDGTTALKFARSRHSLGPEGTDFARGLRQQKIIVAFRAKVFSLGTIFSSDKLTKLKSSITSSLTTDIDLKAQSSLFKLLLGLGSKSNITSISLTDHLTNPKNTTPYAGQWVLLPTPSLSEMQAYVKAQLAK